jgi:hypothetical protein
MNGKMERWNTGIVEYWNVGISGKLDNGALSIIPSFHYSVFYPVIPAFQYSIFLIAAMPHRF